LAPHRGASDAPSKRGPAQAKPELTGRPGLPSATEGQRCTAVPVDRLFRAQAQQQQLQDKAKREVHERQKHKHALQVDPSTAARLYEESRRCPPAGRSRSDLRSLPPRRSNLRTSRAAGRSPPNRQERLGRDPRQAVLASAHRHPNHLQDRDGTNRFEQVLARRAGRSAQAMACTSLGSITSATSGMPTTPDEICRS
jgi:hypothetical protein